MMNITVNGKPYQMDEHSNLIHVLEKVEIGNRFGMAVAVNNTVVPKGEWENRIVEENDNIVIINAISGG
ncbi:MAG: sulfur carrier protein ThiS [Bacteroidales bacterium]|jgi:sulfur carrier protein|nr:sulfur carrier protein ThiS [Bacteroidales bacterium]